MQDRPRTILFGASEMGRAYFAAHRDKLNVIAFADNSPAKHDTEFLGVPVIAPESLPSQDFDRLVITSMYFREIYPQLVEQVGVDHTKIDDIEHILSRLRVVLPTVSADYQGALIRSTNDAVYFGANRFPEFGDQLLQIIERDALSLPPEVWLAVRYAITVHGYLEAAGVARDKARTAALHLATKPEGRADSKTTLVAIKAALDAGDIDQAESLYSAHPLPTEIPQALADYVAIWAGREVAQPIDDAERSFGELVRGRSVAVVGPAPGNPDLGREIDDFDLVVRINYHGCDDLPPGGVAGSRTDVAYYCEQIGVRLPDVGEAPYLDELRFCVFKLETTRRSDVPSRAANRPDEVYFSGTPNMIPIMVFDLLHFAPKRLKVFRSNFYLSDQQHDPGYAAAPPTIATHAVHDPCSQVNLMRNLVVAGVVEFDEGASRVLRMSNSDYLRALEDLYLGWSQS